MKKTRMALILAALLFVSGCGKSEKISDTQQSLKQEGMKLQSAGDYRGAIEKYEEALRMSEMEVGKEEIDIAYYKASAQYQSGDVSGAIDTYSAVLAVKQSEDSYLGRGLLYIAANDMENAEKDLKKVLKETKDPLTQGIIYQVMGETAKAKECFERAKKKGDTEAIFYLANSYEKSGDHKYALLLLEEYIETGEAGAEGYLSVGRKYFESGMYEEALAMIQTGIEKGESGVLKNLLQEEVACYEKLGNFASAKEKAAAYLEKYPEDSAMQKEYEFLKSR